MGHGVLVTVFVCLLLCSSSNNVQGADEGATTQCTQSRKYNRANQKYEDVTIRCDHGCCGLYPKQYCCSFSVGVAVGGLVAAVVGLSVLVVVICCCVKKFHTPQRTVEPAGASPSPSYMAFYRPRTPHHTNINLVYAGGAYGQYPAFAWGRPRRVHPVTPPPYLDQETPPPPYSLSPTSPPFPGSAGDPLTLLTPRSTSGAESDSSHSDRDVSDQEHDPPVASRPPGDPSLDLPGTIGARPPGLSELDQPPAYASPRPLPGTSDPFFSPGYNPALPGTAGLLLDYSPPGMYAGPVYGPGFPDVDGVPFGHGWLGGPADVHSGASHHSTDESDAS